MMGFLCYYGQVQNTSNLGDGNFMNLMIAFFKFSNFKKHFAKYFYF